MENFMKNADWNKGGPVNDPKLRLLSRPTAKTSSKSNDLGQGTRRKGQTAEDFGSSFAPSSSQGRKQAALKHKAKASWDSDSDDELDFLSNAGSDAGAPERKKQKKDVDADAKSSYMAKINERSNVLKSLSFKKNKPPGDGGAKPDASSSKPIVLKDYANSQASSSGPSTLRQPCTGQTTVRRAPSPIRSPERRRSGSNTPQISRDILLSENTRPRLKPRPIGGTRVAPAQHVPDVEIVAPSSPARRATMSGPRPKPFPLFGHSPPRISEPAKKPSKPKPADFPLLSPVNSPLRPAAFPELTPIGSNASLPLHKATRSVSEKVFKAKPAEFPFPSPPSSGSTNLKASKGNGATVKRVGSRLLIKSEEEASNEEDEASIPQAQPFPMSTQMLDSIGSTSVAGPSSLGNRPSSGSEDARNIKKRKDAIPDEYEEEDTVTLADPNTLCPYCDAPLPPSPTPHLKRLLFSMEKKSYREPRPDNPLGRNAPFAVFIAVCQRHNFESQLLPEAERKGWPKSIDWIELEKRVRRMKGALRAVLHDAGPGGGVTDDEEESLSWRPRRKCVFWKEVMGEVKQKGSRAVAGVRGQFASFEKTQPGYGELGSVIIHQTLYDLFPLANIDPNLVSPLTANEFVQRILVPEVGVQLIMEDMGMEESQVGDAVKVLRESANYGVAMFPADEGEEGDDSKGAGEMGVADQIVMERARKRRKELEGVEQEEEEQMKAEQEKQRKATRKQEKERLMKENEKRMEVEPPKPARPRPRPIAKNSSMVSVIHDSAAEMPPSSSQTAYMGEGDTDVEAPPSAQPKRRHGRELGVLTPQKRKIGRTPSCASVASVDLCSSEDDDGGERDTGRLRKDEKNQIKRRPKAASIVHGDDAPAPLSSSSWPTSSRDRVRGTTLSDSDHDGTPKASRSSKLDLSNVPPLQRARDRPKKKDK
ncbi:hypothetical protein DXG03_009513 [Asterophora parasitica]|uniref:Restriction of telomere capping protein 4 n=1 Tax=Asterophora parasitica TaxID=117018 RepID=A0A9P7G5E6_9AGAR|nr:hypothetical protein DXG03_009513 [Asterophora parasitica]